MAQTSASSTNEQKLDAAEREWRAFETASWRHAVRARGLRLDSLDPDQWDAMLESLECGFRPRRRHQLNPVLPRFVVRFRVFSMVVLISIGYSIHEIAQASMHAVNALRATQHLTMTACSMDVQQALALPDSDLTALESRCK